MKPEDPFDLKKEHAAAINALLPECKYVVGIRQNETGEVRFCPENLEWGEKGGLSWWGTGNMSCDCNRELTFRRMTEDVDWQEAVCGEERYTVVGIWFPDGNEYRDMDTLNDF